MSHLLAISIGPVQEFIAAARRTRDMWFGSYLLSEVSRKVAIEVENQGGALIFPASSNADNVANVILAELGTGDSKDVVATAKKVAQDCWRIFAKDAWDAASDVIRADIWDDQVHDVIEFYAAWVARSADYRDDRARVMRLLSGRKNCLDFVPAAGRAGVPKSSLDGQRESVLKPPSEWPRRFRARLRIREGEQLDVVGLVKRVSEGNQPYPSVARVAADPWVRGNQGRLRDVIAACRQLGNRVIRELDTDAYPQFVAFPFEGTAVFTSRHHELEEETEVAADALRPLRDALTWLPEPKPYLAILVADGDKIGTALSRLDSPDEHRAFSQALAGFAASAKKIVNEDHNGVLIYAGGDDVMAFVPVDKCIDCARRLHDTFADSLRQHGPLTLSVGVAIGHFMGNLEDLLEYGRAAEKHAKQPDRDGLAVHLNKRGGAPIEIRARWSDNPNQRINHYADLILDQAIPGKLPYDLRNLARLYEDWPPDTVANAIRQDVMRGIRDKQPRSGRRHMPKIEEALKSQVTDAPSLHRFAKELLVARQLATARCQAGERSTRVTEVAR